MSFKMQRHTLLKYEGTAEEVIIPDGVKEIGERAFSYNKTVKHVWIPDGVEKIGRHAFLHQFIVAALRPHLCSGGDEDLQLSMREDHGANVATVHDDTSFETHRLLLGYHGLAHEG